MFQIICEIYMYFPKSKNHSMKKILYYGIAYFVLQSNIVDV